MAMTPANQYVHGPDSGPVEPWHVVLKGRPQRRHGAASQTDAGGERFVAHGLVHRPTERGSDPAAERQLETALGPLEESRIQPVQPDAAEHLFAAERFESCRIWRAGDRLGDRA